ncbi:unnamed protein product [Gordionus sp. m RMFG-2023]
MPTTEDLLNKIINPVNCLKKDIGYNDILKLDNSLDKENVNPCNSKRKNFETPKSKKYEIEKIKIFRDLLKKIFHDDDKHYIMGFFKSFQISSTRSSSN